MRSAYLYPSSVYEENLAAVIAATPFLSALDSDRSSLPKVLLGEMADSRAGTEKVDEPRVSCSVIREITPRKVRDTSKGPGSQLEEAPTNPVWDSAIIKTTVIGYNPLSKTETHESILVGNSA